MQIRLEPDVEELVKANKEAHGGSLSKAANRLLRASAGKPRVVVNAETWANDPARDLGIIRDSTLNQQNVSYAVKPKRVGRCSHPLLRRIGNSCALCGSTV